MKVIGLLSSHYPGSFTQSLWDQFREGLAEKGHSHELIDLYETQFNPVMAGDDFNQFMGKPLPQDIVTTHKILADADVLACFYPVWWNDMPAIMKGWIDRMFTKDFAYEITADGTKGVLPFKKVLLICTLGNRAEDQHPALEQAMRDKERHGVFGYGGVSDIAHHFLYDVNDADKRQEYLKLVKTLGLNL